MIPIKNIGIVDDQALLRNGLSILLEGCGYRIVLQAGNGRELIERLPQCTLPDLLFVDIHMPVMDGEETVKWVSKNHPLIKVVALCADEDPESIQGMLRAGARGWIRKDCSPQDFNAAIKQISNKGYFHPTTRVFGA